MEREMAEKIKGIEMSEEIKKRIIRNCAMKTEEKDMSKNVSRKYFKKPMAVVASLVLCLCVTGVTTLAATGKLNGFFKNITRPGGAVVGTIYEQATDEVELSVHNWGDELIVELKLLKQKEVPYSTFEKIGIRAYQIVDSDDKVILKGEATEASAIMDGKAEVTISVASLLSGEYRLIVSELEGSKKADQPLALTGVWECEFDK